MDWLKDKFLNKIICADNFDVMKSLPDNSIDLLYSDPPFGITNAKWDIGLNWGKLWPEIWRVLKLNAPVILHSSLPFTFDLVASQRKYFKYNYIWIKNIATNFFLAKKQPLRKHEEICVFYRKQPTYNPQMIGTEKHPKRLVKHGGTEEYWGKAKFSGKWGREDFDNGHFGRYPSTILFYPISKSSPNKEDAGTRVPEMIDFFIKTYSNKEDVVLDITTYTGITPERCRALGRKYIGIEKEEKYCEIAIRRLSKVQIELLK